MKVNLLEEEKAMKKPALLFISLSIAAALCGCGGELNTSTNTGSDTKTSVSSATTETVGENTVEIVGCKVAIPQEWFYKNPYYYVRDDADSPYMNASHSEDDVISNIKEAIAYEETIFEALDLYSEGFVSIEEPHVVTYGKNESAEAIYQWSENSKTFLTQMDIFIHPKGGTSEFDFIVNVSEPLKTKYFNDFSSVLNTITFLNEIPTNTPTPTPVEIKTKRVEAEGCWIDIPEDWRANSEQFYFSDARAPGAMLYIRRDETVDLGDTTKTMISGAEAALESLAQSRDDLTVETAPHEVIRNGYRTVSATYHYMMGTTKKYVCIDFIKPPTGDTLICELK